jgi:hypothetical protein
MSERVIALQQAVIHFEKHGGNVIATAETFLTFLLGQPTSIALPNANATAAKQVATKESVKTKKPAKSEEQLVAEAAARVAATEAAADAEEAPTGATKEAVGKAVEAMLKANKRKEAVALLKKFGAESVSSLAATNYDAFVEEADGVLMSA